MQSENLIALNEFCLHHNIEISFISSLQESGLIEIKTIKDSGFIESSQLQQLEKIIRLFYEFDINLEGIETINHLLNKIVKMNEELIHLKNRLRLYELSE